MVRLSDDDLTKLMRSICREPAPDYHDALFGWLLSEVVSKARLGDKLAAREAAASIAARLWPWVYDHTTRTSHHSPLPVPDFVREYLSEALREIGRGGDANDAFNLSKPGPAKWTEINRLYAVDLVFRLMQRAERLKQRSACDFVASFLADSENGHGSSKEPPCTDSRFCLNPISGGMLEKWYIELRGRVATAVHDANLEK